jgi:hypothetical protein
MRFCHKKVCSSALSQAPECQVSFPGIGRSLQTSINVDVLHTDFSGTSKFMSSVTFGSRTMGSGFLFGTGSQNCSRISRILHTKVPPDAISNESVVIRINTTPDVGENTYNGNSLYAVVEICSSTVLLSNRVSSGSTSITMYGANYGLLTITAVVKTGKTGCEGTEWESETSVGCMTGQGDRGTK